MAEKKSSLTDALARTPTRSSFERSPPVEPPKPPPPATAPRRTPAREQKVNVAAWFPPAVKYALQELALEQSRALGCKITLQELMAEAFNDLFKKYGKPEAAPARNNR
jgi:hypothetical protein